LTVVQIHIFNSPSSSHSTSLVLQPFMYDLAFPVGPLKITVFVRLMLSA